MDIFNYSFMIRALIVGLLLALSVPCIGTVVVLKRLSMIGDALSHAALAGVVLGLVLGVYPTLGAFAACIVSALMVELIRKKLKKYTELSIAIVMAAAIGLAGVLSGYVNSAKSFSSYLFGSIVAITDVEFITIAAMSGVVILCFVLLYPAFFYITFNERLARLGGVKTGIVNFVFTMLTATTVAIAAGTVGALMVSSLMVLPVACALMLARSFKSTVLTSVLFGVAFTLGGIVISFYTDWKPGATIVLVGVACFAVVALASRLKRE